MKFSDVETGRGGRIPQEIEEDHRGIYTPKTTPRNELQQAQAKASTLGPMQGFVGGATRSADTHKPDFEGFLSPRVLIAYGDYMHAHRRQRDGQLRDSDNWQKGIPRDKYMKSLVRHTFDLWLMHRGGRPINPDTDRPFTRKELMSAIMFNIMGYFHETLKAEEMQGPCQTQEVRCE